METCLARAVAELGLQVIVLPLDGDVGAATTEAFLFRHSHAVWKDSGGRVSKRSHLLSFVFNCLTGFNFTA